MKQMRAKGLVCNVPGCRHEVRGRGLCSRHYMQWLRTGDPVSLKPNLCGRPAEERFWKSVLKTDECWNWTAWKYQGYGYFNVNGKLMGTHRFSWILHNGAIPDALCVLYHCDNPSCVKPDHLFIGTKQDNTDDMIAKGRARFRGNRV